MPEFLDRSPPGFLDALKKRIEKTLESYWHEGEHPDEPYHNPAIHIQDLPISTTESGERDKSKDCPFVLLVCTGGKIEDFSDVAKGSGINVLIYFRCFSESLDNQGWRLSTNMMWRVLQNLLERTMVEGYQLEAPIEWSPLNSEIPPYYTALAETTWKGCPPAVEVQGMDIPGMDEESLRDGDGEEIETLTQEENNGI